MKLFRFNEEPIKFPNENLISVQSHTGGLVEIEYIRPLDNQVVCEVGYRLERTI